MDDVAPLDLLPEVKSIEEQAEPLREIVLGGKMGKMSSDDFEKAQNQLRMVLKDETELLFSLRSKIEEAGMPMEMMQRFAAINLQIVIIGQELELICPGMRAAKEREQLYRANLSDAAKSPSSLLNIHPDLPPISERSAGGRDEIVAANMIDMVHLVINDPQISEKVAPELFEKLRSDMLSASGRIMDEGGALRRRDYELIVASLKKLGVAAEGSRDIEHVLRVIEKMGAVVGTAEKAAEDVKSARIPKKQTRLKV